MESDVFDEAERRAAQWALIDTYEGIASGFVLPPTPRSQEEWRTMQGELRNRLLNVLGVVPRNPAPVSAETVGASDMGSYTLERVVYFSRPDFPVTALLYVPRDLDGPAPGIICPHGHAQTGKATSNYQCNQISLAQKGYVVLAPDMIGYNERRASDHAYLGSPLLVGRCLIGMEVWDNMKGIDYLQSRPEVDPGRIGCVGNSGGGTQTLMTAALDERVTAAAPSDATTFFWYDHTKERSICACNVKPRVLPIAEIDAVLGLIAPRWLLLVGGRQDSVFPHDLQKKAYRRARRFYDLMGVEERIDQFITNEPHSLSRAKREAIYGFFNRVLKGIEDPAEAEEPDDEEPLSPEDPRAVCFPNGVPDSLRTATDLVADEVAEMVQAFEPPEDPTGYSGFRAKHTEELRSVLIRREPAQVPLDLEVHHTSEARGPRVEWISFQADEITRLPAVLSWPKRTPERVTALIDPEGKGSQRVAEIATHLVGAGHAVLSLDLRGWGEIKPDELEGSENEELHAAQRALAYDVPLMGLRVQDVQRAVDAVNSRLPGAEVGVYGCGIGGVVACLAALLDPGICEVVLEGIPVTFVAPKTGPSPYPMSFYVPDIIRRVGDIPQLVGLLAPCTTEVRGCVLRDQSIATMEQMEEAFSPARRCFAAAGCPDRLALAPESD